MADYISREATIGHIKKCQCQKCSDNGLCGNCAVLVAMKLLETVPPADVEPVRHGWWDVNRRCSECGNPAPLAYSEPDRWKSPYCPSCGAKMDLDGGEHHERG